MTTGKAGEINITPMIDVLLVLIIIFMVLVPQRSTGLDAQIPQPSNGRSNGHEVVVHVGEDGSVTINTRPVRWEDLDQRLRQIFTMQPDGVLFVSGARQADFQDVARVFDVARGAGVAHVALMPKR
jgi:biopolymer transport protein ExbD